MENKINIAEILRDMPEGIKLYSPLFGKCEYIAVANNEYSIAIKVQRSDGAITKFLMKDGRYFGGYEDAECLLFPSDKMRDWDKFFKRGDVVSVKKAPFTYSFEVLDCIEQRVGAKMLFAVYKNVTDPRQYELLEMSRISGFVDRARGTGRPTKKERRALDAFIDPALFGFDDDDDIE